MRRVIPRVSPGIRGPRPDPRRSCCGTAVRGVTAALPFRLGGSLPSMRRLGRRCLVARWDETMARRAARTPGRQSAGRRDNPGRGNAPQPLISASMPSLPPRGTATGRRRSISVAGPRNGVGPFFRRPPSSRLGRPHLCAIEFCEAGDRIGRGHRTGCSIPFPEKGTLSICAGPMISCTPSADRRVSGCAGKYRRPGDRGPPPAKRP